jgi:hypothetical protein
VRARAVERAAEEGGAAMTMSHEQAIREVAEHLRPVFEESPDGVYV